MISTNHYHPDPARLPWSSERVQAGERHELGPAGPSSSSVERTGTATWHSPMSDVSETAALESTAVLLSRAVSGDDTAKNLLMARYMPILHRWARGRLPHHARDLADTADLVQMTLLRAFRNLARFQSQGEGAFLGYLRQILLNAIRDERRRTARRPAHEPLMESLRHDIPSALEAAIGREQMARYEAGLEALEARQRQAVVLRLEFGFSHGQIADAIDAPSANAARMVVTRALLRLAETIHG